MEKSATVFSTEKGKPEKKEVDVEKLYVKIGKLEIERDFLKKT